MIVKGFADNITYISCDRNAKKLPDVRKTVERSCLAQETTSTKTLDKNEVDFLRNHTNVAGV